MSRTTPAPPPGARAPAAARATQTFRWRLARYHATALARVFAYRDELVARYGACDVKLVGGRTGPEPAVLFVVPLAVGAASAPIDGEAP